MTAAGHLAGRGAAAGRADDRRLVTVRLTLRPGEALNLGPVRVRLADGALYLMYGRRGAVRLTLPIPDAVPAAVRAEADLFVEVSGGAAAPHPPPVLLGPGGDFTQPWPPEDPHA